MQSRPIEPRLPELIKEVVLMGDLYVHDSPRHIWTSGVDAEAMLDLFELTLSR